MDKDKKHTKNPKANDEISGDKLKRRKEPEPEPEPVGRRKRVRKTPITLTLDQTIIDGYTEMAHEQGVSRAASMTLSLTQGMLAWRKARAS